MLLQLFLLLFSIMICAALAAAACAGSGRSVILCRSLGDGFIWLLENTGAFFAFIVVAIQALFIALTACGLLHISKHLLISLDIPYFASLLLLALYHMFKGSPDFSCKAC